MNPEDQIQKVLKETIQHENEVIEKLDNEFFEEKKELQNVEKYLLELGFDSQDTEAIPVFRDTQMEIEYMKLLDRRAELIKQINTTKGELHVFKNSQEN